MADTSENHGGKDSDDFDSHSLHTAVTEDDRIIAYARLILPCDEFPIEQRSGFLPSIFDRNNTIEVSRGFVVKDKCGPGNVFWHLSKCIYSLCQKDELDAILSFSTTVVRNGYRKRGMPFRYVGEPVDFHGFTCHPLIIDIDQHRTPNFLLN
ncbi:MAG: GNAT family N-acetyltransferase [Candidatus Pacebacteria bacterium]|nr:GNAT family N-acetyltransferase [Candidatus Paceibacterota bacterium]